MVVPGPGDHGGAQGAGRVHAGSSEGDLRRGHTLVRVTMFIYRIHRGFDKLYIFGIFRAWGIQKCMLPFAQTPAKLGSH